MTFRTLMVNLELDADNSSILNITGELAARFAARVIGIAACQPLPILYDEGLMATEAITIDRNEINDQIAQAEQAFRAALSGRARALEWRSLITYESLGNYIAKQARAADLIITGRDPGPSLLDESRRVKVGELAMRAGRPLLLVPKGISSLSLRRVFVGWKDTREARRAAADALPLLKEAGQVTVLEITGEANRLSAQRHVEDVAAWLGEHGVSATPQAIVASGTETSYLHAELLDRRCDLLVAGAWGHNRLSQFVFGGVTRDILMDPSFCVLLSH
jgi:nucleotide-binding universal stress UspA family protein